MEVVNGVQPISPGLYHHTARFLLQELSSAFLRAVFPDTAVSYPQANGGTFKLEWLSMSVNLSLV